MKTEKNEPKANLAAIVEAIRDTLGDLADGKQTFIASSILARQVEYLGRSDPRYKQAFVDLTAERVATYFTDPDTREKVLTDDNDPMHVFWIMIVPSVLLRSYARRKITPPEHPLEAMMKRLGGTIIPLSDPDDDLE